MTIPCIICSEAMPDTESGGWCIAELRDGRAGFVCPSCVKTDREKWSDRARQEYERVASEAS